MLARLSMPPNPRNARRGGLPAAVLCTSERALAPPMDTVEGVNVRLALLDELEAICDFGAMVIPDHYQPLLGRAAAQAQVDDWWTQERMSRAIDESRVVVAEEQSEILGVAEWSLYDGVPVVWKLYVHPSRRGEGIEPRLIDAIIDDPPVPADHLRVETFAVNRRACSFYEREGFREFRTVEHSNPTLNVIWFERPLD